MENGLVRTGSGLLRLIGCFSGTPATVENGPLHKGPLIKTYGRAALEVTDPKLRFLHRSAQKTRPQIRKLEKAVAVSGVCPGVLEENSGKIAGKFSRIGKCYKFWDFGRPAKANLPGTLGPHCRDLVPTYPAGCFLKSAVPAFSSFSDQNARISSETGIGGVKSPKIRGGGGVNLEIPGVPEIDPFLQRFYRKSPTWGSKVQVFEGQLSVRIPPPPAPGTF